MRAVLTETVIELDGPQSLSHFGHLVQSVGTMLELRDTPQQIAVYFHEIARLLLCRRETTEATSAVRIRIPGAIEHDVDRPLLPLAPYSATDRGDRHRAGFRATSRMNAQILIFARRCAAVMSPDRLLGTAGRGPIARRPGCSGAAGISGGGAFQNCHTAQLRHDIEPSARRAQQLSRRGPP
jgi:hypothetical protein